MTRIIGGWLLALAFAIGHVSGADFPLPNVEGKAQLEVRKKHWRLFPVPPWKQEELAKRGIDPRFRYGKPHYLEIKFITKPELKSGGLNQ